MAGGAERGVIAGSVVQLRRCDKCVTGGNGLPQRDRRVAPDPEVEVALSPERGPSRSHDAPADSYGWAPNLEVSDDPRTVESAPDSTTVATATPSLFEPENDSVEESWPERTAPQPSPEGQIGKKR